VALSWLLDDAGAGQAYAVATFDVLTRAGAEAFVPATWSLEIANVIAKSEAPGILLPNRSQAFLSALGAAPVECDGDSHSRALSETSALARRYGLSGYDASYLELALRRGLPLATLGKDLANAAQRAGIKRFQVRSWRRLFRAAPIPPRSPGSHGSLR
jgi:predicted nucleic acid-binding protein